MANKTLEEYSALLNRYVNTRSIHILCKFSDLDMTLQEAIVEVQGLCKAIADGFEENGFNKGREFGYRQGIQDYRRMQEKNI